jgi:hypothetical protein
MLSNKEHERLINLLLVCEYFLIFEQQADGKIKIDVDFYQRILDNLADKNLSNEKNVYKIYLNLHLRLLDELKVHQVCQSYALVGTNYPIFNRVDYFGFNGSHYNFIECKKQREKVKNFKIGTKKRKNTQKNDFLLVKLIVYMKFIIRKYK